MNTTFTLETLLKLTLSVLDDKGPSHEIRQTDTPCLGQGAHNRRTKRCENPSRARLQLRLPSTGIRAR